LQDIKTKAIQQAAQIMEQMNKGGLNSPEGTAGLKNIMDMSNTMITGQLADMTRLVIPVTLKNKTFPMVDQTLDAKVLNTTKQMTQLIQYGTLHIVLKRTKEQ
jgi:hypothetical protein